MFGYEKDLAEVIFAKSQEDAENQCEQSDTAMLVVPQKALENFMQKVSSGKIKTRTITDLV